MQPHQVPGGAQQPVGAPAAKARLQCHYCGRLLEYDAGAQYVQCFSCNSMNASQHGNSQMGGRVLAMMCAFCNTTNLAQYGFSFVRCGSCGVISEIREPRPDQVE
eukprot:Selendium_serpulae@DN3561_c0_g1_i1.p1